MWARAAPSLTEEIHGFGPASSEEGRLAHRKLWRQIIFWLSHKENDSENHVKLTLDPPAGRRGRKGRGFRHRPRRQGRHHPQRQLRDQSRARRARSQSRACRPVRPGRGSTRLDLRHRKDRTAGQLHGHHHRPHATAKKSAETRRGSSFTRTTASWKTPPPTSNWPARSPKSPAASR